MGERNVCLKCEVRAQPRLTALFWIIDDNGTTVYEGEVVDRYWTLVLVRYLRLLTLLYVLTYTVINLARHQLLTS